MGCNIHCYVEYRKPNSLNPYARDWRSFGKRINPGRNYRIFGKLAGVRWPTEQVAPARGYPDDAASYARDDFWMWIDYEGESAEYGGENYCTPEKAAEWHRYGHRYSGIRTVGGDDVIGKPTYIEHPDWHTPSWVTANEWERAIAGDPEEHEYRAMLAAMRSLEADGFETRVVFWFDN